MMGLCVRSSYLATHHNKFFPWITPKGWGRGVRWAGRIVSDRPGVFWFLILTRGFQCRNSTELFFSP